MHIVHKVENKFTQGGKVKGEDGKETTVEKSQFTNGVMGFLFKCMPESYFLEASKANPDVDIYYHDKFLSDMLDDEAGRAGA